MVLNDIFALAQNIEQHINEHWETVFSDVQQEMIDQYPEIGDSVYGIYGTHLFREILAQMKQAGLRSTPRLPFGNFASSREWGEEDDRQRWLWSKITTTEGAALGTIAVAFYHDHEQIRIPRAPLIIALIETTKAEVVKALSQRSPEFAQALEARIEYAEYLK